MAIRVIILVITIVCYISYYGKAQEDTIKLSKEEELELEKELNLLNKPAIKTIKTDNGVIYDCIDFFKQPAFDHPLLKNHSYHYKMKPSSRPKTTNENKESLGIGLKGVGCPIGTVPIRRTTKEDLIRSKLFTKTYSSSRFGSFTPKKPGLRRAVLRTIADPSKKYNGGGVVTSVYQPGVTGSQFSSSQMSIINGPDSIQVGWTVNPTLYGDSKTHLFAYLQAGATSCFNTQCPGFVIVSTQIPLDIILQPVSQRGGPTFTLSLFVYRDQANGNWWLEVGPNSTQVGFWPGRIFSALDTGLATYMEWGGEAYTPLGQAAAPMGSGFFPQDQGKQISDAYCQEVTEINESHEQVNADNTELFSDDGTLYGVKDWGPSRGNLGHVMFFGGPSH
ncbi:protein neprosin-like [Humulus lupulus]|uniref:protein neprosin-like n=1 Tax=Humulus lupulus TaxID=3486 RepID=UPI002B413EA7|nr:protein neprosin-like [Humulus lupulus]